MKGMGKGSDDGDKTMIILLIVKVADSADNNMKIKLLYDVISCGIKVVLVV